MRFHWLLMVPFFVLAASAARADFLVSSAILEFTADGPTQQDVELISRSKDSDYIVTEVSEVVHPGMADESRREVSEPEDDWLLVTPDKSVLAGGGRKIVRFVLLQAPDTQERIYRVAIKPVINEMTSTSKVGLKVLVGYEVLVVIRPAQIAPAYQAARRANMLTVTNTGNSNVLFQNGRQCDADADCPMPPSRRVYPGQQLEMELPQDKPVTYSVWDGVTNVEKVF